MEERVILNLHCHDRHGTAAYHGKNVPYFLTQKAAAKRSNIIVIMLYDGKP